MAFSFSQQSNPFGTQQTQQQQQQSNPFGQQQQQQPQQSNPFAQQQQSNPFGTQQTQQQQQSNPFGLQTQQQPQPQQSNPFGQQTQQQQQQSNPFGLQTPQQQQPTSLFQTPQQPQQQQLFQTPQQPQQQQQSNLFGTFNQTPQQQQQPQQQPQFNFQQQQQQQQQQQTQGQQPLSLFTNDKAPATYSTKWADLHPDSQKKLLETEKRILEYKDESQRLDQCSRLYDSSVFNSGFELDASGIVQELGGISSAMERQRAICNELMVVVKDMLRNTEIAVRSFMMLRPRFLRSTVGNSAPSTTSQGSGVLVAQTSTTQTSAMVPVFDFYSGLPKKPSPFLQETVARFEKDVAECRQWIEELEQLILLISDKNSINSSSSLLQSLPKIIANVHDYFIHVAAKVESIHQYIESMKTAYLVHQRNRGDGNDPFLEADRREIAKREAAAQRVHPSLHLLQVTQPSTQFTGLLPGSGTPAAANTTTPLTSVTVSTSSSGGGFTQSNAPLFPTPSTSAQTSLFGIPGPSTQPSPFTPQPSTPTINTNPFTITPPTGQPAIGSGASLTQPSKPRVKARGTRR